MALFHVSRQVAAGLGNDLDTPFHDPLVAPISFKAFQWNAAEQSAYPLAGFHYVD